MKKLTNSKKGVSPIIATLLLIVIAVAAGVVTYTFVTGFIGSSTSQTGPTGTLSVDAYSFDSSTGNLTAYIRNSGSKAVTISNIYFNGTLLTNTSSTYWLSSTDLTVGSVTTLSIVGTYITNPANANTVKIVCTDGTQLEFSVRKT